MKKLKKIFPIIIVLLCLTLVLVACTPSEQGDLGNENDNNGGGVTDDGGNTSPGDDSNGGTGLKPTPEGPLMPANNYFVFEKIGEKKEYAVKSAIIVDKEVVIPSLYNESPVTAILPQAFYSDDVIEEVVLPDTIKTIGERAFSLCVNLKKVSISAYSELESIGDRAFFSCDRLSEITFPEGLSKVGSEAFGGCIDLINLTFPTALYEVGSGAFDCGWLDAVNQNGVVYAGNVAYSFYYSESEPATQSVVIKDGTTAIAGKAFYGQDWIASVSIPASVTHIGELALCNTARLENIIVSGENTVYSALGNALVEKATNTLLASTLNTTVMDGVEVIGEEAFAYSALTTITLPASVTHIGKGAFKQSKIMLVNIPASVRTIEEETFLNAEFLASITIHADLASIKTSAFNYCLSLKEVVVENAGILESLDTPYACSGLIARAEVVYVLDTLEAQADSLIADFDQVTSDRAGYKKYVLEN